MASFFLLIPLLLVASAIATHDEATSPSEMYWRRSLPNTPMPPAIDDLLYAAEIKTTNRHKPGPYSPVFEKDMLSGTELTMDFVRSTSTFGGTFISRQAASSIPFSSANLPSILKRFSIDPKSHKADAIVSRLLRKASVSIVPPPSSP